MHRWQRRFKHHQNSTRRPPEREKERKGVGEKKREILGCPAEGGPRRVPEGWGPPRRVGGGPEGWGPRNLALFFFPRPPLFSFFLPLLGSWNFGGVIEGRDPQMCAFGVLGLSCETPAPKQIEKNAKRKKLKSKYCPNKKNLSLFLIHLSLLLNYFYYFRFFRFLCDVLGFWSFKNFCIPKKVSVSPKNVYPKKVFCVQKKFFCISQKNLSQNKHHLHGTLHLKKTFLYSQKSGTHVHYTDTDLCTLAMFLPCCLSFLSLSTGKRRSIEQYTVHSRCTQHLDRNRP